MLYIYTTTTITATTTNTTAVTNAPPPLLLPSLLSPNGYEYEWWIHYKTFYIFGDGDYTKFAISEGIL